MRRWATTCMMKTDLGCFTIFFHLQLILSRPSHVCVIMRAMVFDVNGSISLVVDAVSVAVCLRLFSNLCEYACLCTNAIQICVSRRAGLAPNSTFWLHRHKGHVQNQISWKYLQSNKWILKTNHIKLCCFWRIKFYKTWWIYWKYWKKVDGIISTNLKKFIFSEFQQLNFH